MSAPGVPGTQPGVSVVVPTRDRPDRLAVCLAALGRQTAPTLEIVVVDDASRDAAAVAAVVAAVPGARLVRGEGRGPAAARNAGVAAARAPIVCLTDDDCEPVPGWAAALVARIRSASMRGVPPASMRGVPPASMGGVPPASMGGVPPASTGHPVPAAAAAGPTRNGRPGSVCAAAAQAIASHLAEATMDADTGRMRFAPTSNLACATAVLRAVPFDERYPLAAGEDRDWCARLLAAGYPLLFEPEALVRHHQELTPAGFWRQQVRYGRGGYRFRADHRTLLRPEPAGFYAGLLRRGFAEGPRAGLLVGLAQVATAVGMAREAMR